LEKLPAMKKLLSINYSPWGFNISMLILRLGAGALMLQHGYDKLVKFGAIKKDFMSFLGMGSTASLALLIFAEFFCSMFLIMGLFTRLSAIPLIIGMCVALFKAHNGDFWGDGEQAAIYLVSFVVIFICGPGKVSVDGLINK
jgi:putative oxidoreductase